MVDAVSFLGRRLLPANTLLSTEANIDAEEEDEEEEKEQPANRRDKGRQKKKTQNTLAAKRVNFSQAVAQHGEDTQSLLAPLVDTTGRAPLIVGKKAQTTKTNPPQMEPSSRGVTKNHNASMIIQVPVTTER